MKKWIVFANAKECNVFEQKKKELLRKQVLTNPEGHHKGGRVFSDGPTAPRSTPGRTQVSLPENHYFEEVERKFAKEIAEFLNREHHLGHFDELTIVSGPAFIGYLREAVPKTLREAIIEEVVKNVNGHSQDGYKKVANESGGRASSQRRIDVA